MFVLQVLFPVPGDRTAAKQKAAAHCSFKSFYKTQFLMHLKHLQYLPGETPKPSRLKYTLTVFLLRKLKYRLSIQ